MFDLFEIILFGGDFDTAIEVSDNLEKMWEELDMLEEAGDYDAMDRVFDKYHHNLMALAEKSESHIAWAVE